MSILKQIPVAISGLARVGKDSFCQFLCEELKAQNITAKRFALADELKTRIRGPLKDLSGIDIMTCPIEEKELVRDYLVAVGKIKRKQSEGRYWTSLLEAQIRDSNIQVPVITDIRYDVFPEDEVWWAQKHMKGVLVHILRHEVVDESDVVDFHHNPYVKLNEETKEWRHYVEPPNEDEKKNDPKLRAKADYVIDWPSAPDLTKLRDHCLPYVRQFISFLKSSHLRT